MTKTKTTTVAVRSILSDPELFEHAQRVGRMIGISPLFPEHLRKGGADVAMANAVLVQDMANRLGRPPMEVAQNIYFVSGKPGWSTSYLIGLANESGKLKKSIDWKVAGKGDDLEVEAFAELSTGSKVKYSVSMAMAKAEGWVKNPKYKSLPELMLRYRSATALIRLYMPEITMGVPAQEEVMDPEGMRDVTPQPAASSKAPKDTADLVADDIVDAEIVPVEEEPEPDTQEEPDEEDMERHEQLKDMILSEIGACEDIAMLDDVLAMYADQIEQLSAFSSDMGDAVEDAAGKRKAALK